jgi:uncharacterized protein (TIGR02147 family)
MLIEKDKVSIEDPIRKLLTDQIALNKKIRPVVILNPEQLKKINHWYFYALRQLARLIPIPRNINFLKDIFQNDESKVNYIEALDTLTEHGFVHKTEDSYCAANLSLDTSNNFSSESIKEYHEEVGTLAVKAIRKYDINQRNFQGCTLVVNRSKLAQANSLIEKFIDDFETIMDSAEGDSVYQINVQLFPLVVLNEQSSP